MTLHQSDGVVFGPKGRELRRSQASQTVSRSTCRARGTAGSALIAPRRRGRRDWTYTNDEDHPVIPTIDKKDAGKNDVQVVGLSGIPQQLAGLGMQHLTGRPQQIQGVLTDTGQASPSASSRRRDEKCVRSSGTGILLIRLLNLANRSTQRAQHRMVMSSRARKPTSGTAVGRVDVEQALALPSAVVGLGLGREIAERARHAWYAAAACARVGVGSANEHAAGEPVHVGVSGCTRRGLLTGQGQAPCLETGAERFG
jgi:hypothetical protein